MSKKILILGGHGYIGNSIRNLLIKRKASVSSLGRGAENDHQCDLHSTSISDLNKIFINYDVILCCAWYVNKTDYQFSSENETWAYTYIKNIIPAINLSQVGHVIGIGSCLEYGAIRQGPVNKFSSLNPDTSYAFNKLKVMNQCRDTLKSTVFTWARLFYVYGGAEHELKLIPSIRRKINEGKQFEFKNPEIITDFVHIGHVSESIYWLIENSHAGTVNLGSGSPVKNKDLIDLIKNNQQIMAGRYTGAGMYSSDVYLCDKSRRI